MIFEPGMIINDLSAEDLAVAIRVTQQMAEWWLSPTGGNLPDKEPVQLGEFLTNRCDDCREAIKIYDSAAWRTKIHPLRCPECVKLQIEAGATDYEAKYVV